MKRFIRTFLAVTIVSAGYAADNDNLASKKEQYLHLKKAFVNPVDNPSLPRVLIIGDSISIGYTVPLRKKLQDKANIHRRPQPKRPDLNVRRYMSKVVYPNDSVHIGVFRHDFVKGHHFR